MNYTYVIGKTNINLVLGDSHYTILVDSDEGQKIIQLISEGADGNYFDMLNYAVFYLIKLMENETK